MPPTAQRQTSRAAQASPLLAQTILLLAAPAFSGLLASRLSGILLSNIETCSGLPRPKKRTGSPFDPVSPPAAASHSRYTSSRELLVRLSPFLPSHVPARPPESGFCPPPSTQTPLSSRWLLPGRQALSPSPAPQRPSPPALRALLASPTALLRSVCGTAFPCFSPHPWHPSCQVRPPPSALQPQAASLPSSSEL